MNDAEYEADLKALEEEDEQVEPEVTLPRVLFDKILVERIEEKVSSIIEQPDSIKSPSTKGRIVAVGEGKPMADGSIRPLRVKIGDIVRFGFHSGLDIPVGKRKFVVMREDEVLAVESCS